MMRKKTTKNPPILLSAQRGSIFFYILLGVALFGVLSFTIARGMRGQSTEMLSKRQVEIATSEILADAQILARGVDTLRQRGISESDLCFTSPSNSPVNERAYEAIEACADDVNKLYHTSGGGISFMPVGDDWLEASHVNDAGYGEWMFSNQNAVEGLGESELGDARAVELIAHVNHMKKEVCESINKELGIEGIPNNAGAFHANAPVSGPFAAGGQINALALAEKKSGCFQNTNTWNSYIFYTVLIERD